MKQIYFSSFLVLAYSSFALAQSNSNSISGVEERCKSFAVTIHANNPTSCSEEFLFKRVEVALCWANIDPVAPDQIKRITGDGRLPIYEIKTDDGIKLRISCGMSLDTECGCGIDTQ